MLIFDFDGVLINSVDEVAITAFNAATGRFITSLDALPGTAAMVFKRNRFHVQQIGDAIPLMNWCLAHDQIDPETILSLEEYQPIVAGVGAALSDRTNLIYETRKRFIDENCKNWLALHKPYQPLWRELIRHVNDLFVILTNKNQDATMRLCHHFGLNIKEYDIYSGDHGVTKADNMRQIQDRFRRKIYLFIDDSVKNLKELDLEFNRDGKILSLSLASWGYTGPEDAKTAKENGYPVYEQTDVISLFEQKVVR